MVKFEVRENWSAPKFTALANQTAELLSECPRRQHSDADLGPEPASWRRLLCQRAAPVRTPEETPGTAWVGLSLRARASVALFRGPGIALN